MKYIAKLHNYPLTWKIDAESESDAQVKAWEAIRADMEPDSISAGGFLEVRETYRTMKDRQQKEVNAFPFVWAFSDEQFYKGIREKWGYGKTDVKKILSIGAGGFIRKSDRDALEEMLQRHRDELKKAIDADHVGSGFIFEMFDTELSNHEYCVTCDITDTLNACGISRATLEGSAALKYGLKKAIDAQRCDE